MNALFIVLSLANFWLWFMWLKIYKKGVEPNPNEQVPEMVEGQEEKISESDNVLACLCYTYLFTRFEFLNFLKVKPGEDGDCPEYDEQSVEEEKEEEKEKSKDKQ